MRQSVVFRAACVAAGFLAVVPVTASAQGNIRTERVRFERGSSNATIQGRITGDETIDYIVNAREGQHANVTLITRNTATYFNMMAPGETEVAFFIGSTSGNEYEGTLPASGDFRIRVYMMRSAARRNETAQFELEIAIAAGGPSPDDALVAGTDFHATGEIPCSMGGGQPTTQCRFGVRREGNGGGSVTVWRPDRRTRTIFFENGRATGYDESQADPGEFRATREGDVITVHIGNERYEIVDAIIFGG